MKMNWLKEMIISMAWPSIKKFILEYVQSDEYQKELVAKINNKVDIPNVTEETEAMLFNQVYDAGQETIVEFVNNVDIKQITEKVFK
ncbi:MAG: hypothetical protein ACOC22_04630 [bacterium]